MNENHVPFNQAARMGCLTISFRFGCIYNWLVTA
jgi:hypothetical protein